MKVQITDISFAGIIVAGKKEEERLYQNYIIIKIFRRRAVSREDTLKKRNCTNRVRGKLYA